MLISRESPRVRYASCPPRMHSTYWRLSIGTYLLVLTFVLLFAESALAFNVAINSSRVIEVSRRPASLFGFSVTFKKDQTVNYLVVGAPKATEGKNVKSSGATYRIALRDGAVDRAQPIPFDVPYPPSNNVTMIGSERRQIERKDFQLQGFTVATPSLHGDGLIMSCSPKYTYYSQRGILRQPIGTCHLMNSGKSIPISPCKADVDSWLSRCYPAKTEQECKVAGSSNVDSLGFCQAGFSASFAPQGETVVMGAPGSDAWTGALFAYDVTTTGVNSTITTHNPHRVGQLDAAKSFQYLGYSVAFGELNGNADFMEVVASAPRYSNVTLRGLVYVFERLSGSQSLFQVGRETDATYTLTGQQSGAYFGYKVLSFDINGDHLDDIIVSAPMYTDYSNNLYDVGRVYVFLQTREARSPLRFDSSMRLVIDPPKPKDGARFGHAIANAGDVNDDGYFDLYIGEPYGGPDGNGVVHLYAFIDRELDGIPAGIRRLQTISAADVLGVIKKPLKSFGFAIAANFSTNQADQTPDLAVGAPESNNAVYIRTSPVARIITTFRTIPQEDFVVNPEDTSCGSVSRCFLFQVCAKLKRNEVSSIQAVVNVTIDSLMAHGEKRVRLTQSIPDDESEMYEKRHTASLSAASFTCWQIPIYFRNEVTARNKNIRMTVQYTLRDTQPPDEADLLPVIDQFDQTANCEVFIMKDCRETKQCLADLAIDVRSVESLYMIDSNRSIEFQVTVQNSGDPAGNTQLRIAIPIGADYESVNESCAGEQCAPAPSCSPQEAGVDPASSDYYPDNVVLCAFGEFPGAKIAENGSETVTKRTFTFSFSAARYNSTLNRKNMLSRIDKLQKMYAELDEDYEAIPNLSIHGLLFEFNLTSEIDERNDDYRNNFAMANVNMKADLQLVVYGSSQPEQLLLNSSATQQKTNITNAKQLTDFAVAHKYEVRNAGWTRIAEMDLTILWPFKFNEQFAMYLAEAPKVTRGNGSCQVKTTLDPLSLFRTDSASSKKPTVAGNNSVQAETERNKRSTGSFFGVDIGSSVPEKVDITCQNAQCIEIVCKITNINVTANAIVEVRSYVWWTTMLRLGAKEISVSSQISPKITKLTAVPDFTEANWTSTLIKTEAKTSVIVPYDADVIRVPLWAIATAVVLGILLFLIILIVLIICGFFKRHRPPANAAQQPPADMLGRLADPQMIPNEYAMQIDMVNRGSALYTPTPYEMSQRRVEGTAPTGPYYRSLPQTEGNDEVRSVNGRSSVSVNRMSPNQFDAAAGQKVQGKQANNAAVPSAAYPYTEMSDFGRVGRSNNNSGSNTTAKPSRMQF